MTVFTLTNTTSHAIKAGSNGEVPAYGSRNVNWISARAVNQILAGNLVVAPVMLEPTTTTSPYLPTSTLVSGTSTLAQVTTALIALQNLVASMYNNSIDREAGSTEDY